MKIAIAYEDHVELVEGPDDMINAEYWADGYVTGATDAMARIGGEPTVVDVVVLAPGWAAALRDPPLAKRILEAMQ